MASAAPCGCAPCRPCAERYALRDAVWHEADRAGVRPSRALDRAIEREQAHAMRAGIDAKSDSVGPR